MRDDTRTRALRPKGDAAMPSLASFRFLFVSVSLFASSAFADLAVEGGSDALSRASAAVVGVRATGAEGA